MKTLALGMATLLAVLFVGFILYTVFIYIPVNIYTEAECLKQGYPKHKVSVGLERYCLTIEGVIAPKVIHQGDKK